MSFATTPRERRSPSTPWAQTASGRAVSITRPLPQDVCIADIAAHLAKQCRFAGASNLFYSVAQHSVLVSEMFGDPLEALYALLHDAHEAYLGDIISPVKAALFAPDQRDRLAALVELHDYAIRVAIGINPELGADVEAMIKQADLIALWTEKRDVMNEAQRPWSGQEFAPLARRIKPLTWDKAEILFLRRFRELCALTGINADRTARHPRAVAHQA